MNVAKTIMMINVKMTSPAQSRVSDGVRVRVSYAVRVMVWVRVQIRFGVDLL